MHAVEYSSSRREVWRWYWRAWVKPNGLWWRHVVIAFVAALVLSLIDLDRFNLGSLIGRIGLMLLLCLIVFPLWPQVRFKPEKRSLTIDPDGFNTQIREMSLPVPWRDVRDIEDSGEEIVISGKNGNAMIVPRRAFQSDSQRTAFLTDAKRWFGESAA